MQVYFDNAATTKPLDCVIKKMLEAYEDYGNPSSLHRKGIQAEVYVSEARQILAKILKIEEKELLFTSGGTESNNIAVIGTALANKREGKHIIISDIEHDSIRSTAKMLEENGFEVTKIPVNGQGVIDINYLDKEIREDTVLVSVMHVNNEIGTIQPINEVGKIIKNQNQKTIFHVDAIQSFGKLIIYPKRSNIDLLSISAHKVHGPKGVGALYVNNNTKIKPIIYGGGQQKGLRSGTENVAGIAGLGISALEAYKNFETKIAHLTSIKKTLVEGIINKIENVIVNGLPYEESAPHIVNLRFENIQGEVLLHTLEQHGVYVSTGSACSSNKSATSHTLKSIGLNNNEINESIRFSFCVNNTIEEVNYCIQILAKEIPFLRKYVRGGKK